MLTPFGGKLHHALKLALLGRIRERLGLTPACLHADDGLLFRLPAMDEPPLDLLDGLTGELAERLIREELPETALFGLRFRQNAARALAHAPPRPGQADAALAPAAPRQRPAPGRPAVPRLPDRARDRARVPRRRPRPAAAPRAPRLRFRSGTIRVVRRRGEIPSPFTSELIFQFTAAHLYEWDEPKRSDRQPVGSVVDEDLLEPLLARRTARRLARPAGDRPGRESAAAPRPAAAHRGRDGRTSAAARRPDALGARRADGRHSWPSCATRVEPSRSSCPARPSRRAGSRPRKQPLYRVGVPGLGAARDATRCPRRRSSAGFLQTHALIGLADLTARYPIAAVEAAELLERWSEEGKVVRLGESGSTGLERAGRSGRTWPRCAG